MEKKSQNQQIHCIPKDVHVQCWFDLSLCRYDRSSLKVLGTVGEPINPEAWLWYYNVIGDKRCAIVDTFWQTETVSVSSSSAIISLINHS